MEKKRTAVLIGGSGLLGGTIVNYYKTRFATDIEIRAPSSKKVSIRVESDICSYLNEVKPDFVINAAMAKLGAGNQLAYEVNYLGAVNLARGAVSLGVPYIHLSSAAVMPVGLDITEEQILPLSPGLNAYAKSKLMAELTLRRMAKEEGLDYSCIRLAIVYGAHDHKIQGFQRMLLSLADQSMPLLFTSANTLHSYSNSRKLPFLINHMLNHREKFRGQTYNFADPQPADLTNLILHIKKLLHLKVPKEIHVPFWLANIGRRGAEIVIRLLRKTGLKATLPPELMFLENFYKSQTLSIEKLKNSSFSDPLPTETIYTRLPGMAEYYLTRWANENLITLKAPIFNISKGRSSDFVNAPENLLAATHERGLGPLPNIVKR
jgi:nucleoside-diphosphate-sugar epimerase